jgi:hypothetical protein
LLKVLLKSILFSKSGDGGHAEWRGGGKDPGGGGGLGKRGWPERLLIEALHAPKNIFIRSPMSRAFE